MRSKKLPKGLLLLATVAAALVQSACSDNAAIHGSKKYGSASANSSNAQAEGLPDPCVLLTAGDARALANGSVVVETRRIVPGHAELVGSGECKYRRTDNEREVTLDVLAWSDPEQAKQQFDGLRRQVSHRESEVTKQVPGLADDAYQSTSTTSRDLYLHVQDYILVLRVHSLTVGSSAKLGTDDETIFHTAKAVLSRLP